MGTPQRRYDYYDLPFCEPKELVQSPENLGEILMGDVIENTKSPRWRISRRLNHTGRRGTPQRPGQ